MNYKKTFRQLFFIPTSRENKKTPILRRWIRSLKYWQDPLDSYECHFNSKDDIFVLLLQWFLFQIVVKRYEELSFLLNSFKDWNISGCLNHKLMRSRFIFYILYKDKTVQCYSNHFVFWITIKHISEISLVLINTKWMLFNRNLDK